MDSIVKEEIERMESIGMMPFNAAEKLLIQKGYNISKSKIEALQKEVEELREDKELEVISVDILKKDLKREKERVKELEEGIEEIKTTTYRLTLLTTNNTE